MKRLIYKPWHHCPLSHLHPWIGISPCPSGQRLHSLSSGIPAEELQLPSEVFRTRSSIRSTEGPRVLLQYLPQNPPLREADLQCQAQFHPLKLMHPLVFGCPILTLLSIILCSLLFSQPLVPGFPPLVRLKGNLLLSFQGGRHEGKDRWHVIW